MQCISENWIKMCVTLMPYNIEDVYDAVLHSRPTKQLAAYSSARKSLSRTGQSFFRAAFLHRCGKWNSPIRIEHSLLSKHFVRGVTTPCNSVQQYYYYRVSNIFYCAIVDDDRGRASSVQFSVDSASMNQPSLSICDLWRHHSVFVLLRSTAAERRYSGAVYVDPSSRFVELPPVFPRRARVPLRVVASHYRTAYSPTHDKPARQAACATLSVWFQATRWEDDTDRWGSSAGVVRGPSYTVLRPNTAMVCVRSKIVMRVMMVNVSDLMAYRAAELNDGDSEVNSTQSEERDGSLAAIGKRNPCIISQSVGILDSIEFQCPADKQNRPAREKWVDIKVQMTKSSSFSSPNGTWRDCTPLLTNVVLCHSSARSVSPSSVHLYGTSWLHIRRLFGLVIRDV